MKVTQSHLNLCDSMKLSRPNTGVGSLSLLQGIFPTSDQTQSPTFQADSLPTELSGKPQKLLSRVQLFAIPWTVAD